MRLELSRRTDIALRAVRHLEEMGGRITRQDLAAATGTTPDFFARVVAPLVKAGWVRSEPGRGGGYQLSVDPEQISVLDLIEITEGVPASTTCVLRGGPCDVDGRCELHEAWSAARDALLRQLDATPVGRQE